MSYLIGAVLNALLILTASTLIWARDLFAVIVLLSVYSGLLSMLFATLGAVDVAFTEAVVGTGVSTVFLFAVVRRVDARIRKREGVGPRLAALAMAAVMAGTVLYTAEALPDFGDPEAPAMRHVAPSYLKRSMADMETPNVVTAVLADYRGFDTLIETAVVLTAALACLLILGEKHDPPV